MTEVINYIYQTWAKKVAVGVFALTLVFSALAFIPAADAAKKNNKNDKEIPCKMNNNRTGAKINEHGRSITATFEVPKSCKNDKKVSFVVYELKDGNWKHKVNNQFIFSSKTVMAKPGKKTSITLPLPNCAYQADLVEGNPVKINTGADQNPILVAKVGGNAKPCANKPVKPVTPVKPVKPVKPVTPVTPERPAGVKASDEYTAPEALPETGPGAIVGTFVGVSSLGALIHRIVLRRFGEF